jgi:4-hydroxybenzoate polyprenyltransferase/phosphoserine phosphatase
MNERPTKPLIVDLDDTLLCGDMLFYAFFAVISADMRTIWQVLKKLFQGKAALKAFLAERAHINYAKLPYRKEVLQLIEKAKAEGREVCLATASHQIHAEGVAKHLGVFDGIFASTSTINLKAEKKAEKLKEQFGNQFTYVGNSEDDIKVWQQATEAVIVSNNRRLIQKLKLIHQNPIRIAPQKYDIRMWLKQLRVHQYSKNALLFVPLLTSHSFNLTALFQATLAAVLFSAVASSVYMMNDLLDLETDRNNPKKSTRPLAAGRIAIPHAILVALPLLLGGMLVAALVLSQQFLLVIITYFILTSLYSTWLKQVMMLDVVLLAMLYTIRVIAGAAAISVPLSEWLLIFSLFVFTSLALVKRYVELNQQTLDNNHSRRGYTKSDAVILEMLAVAAAMNANLIFALYISSNEVANAYHSPAILWLLSPLFLYWLSRVLIFAHRGVMHHDPIIFALKDKLSRYILGLMIVIIAIAAR